MNSKKILAGKLLKASPSKVIFAEDALSDIQKAITRSDMRGLIAIGKVALRRTNEQSRGRARKLALQKRKGRRSGRGSRKGAKYASVTRKELWMQKIRTQRKFLKELKAKGLLTSSSYRNMYQKSKGGYFRNKRHIKLYLDENKLVQREVKTK
ncbi:50S ribosomal protein L19e [archaeon]|nr:50S ribosomal protein L19e [archaeon]|tara:strand:- start:3000 stop:3458 length:459 start_codon:yes stop_codon:yes gene_type:complete